jgi:hypothetical protein
MVATANGGRLPVAPGNQCDHFGPRHQQVHFVKKLALELALGLAFEPTLAQACLPHACNASHLAGHAEVLLTIPKPIRNLL